MIVLFRKKKNLGSRNFIKKRRYYSLRKHLRNFSTPQLVSSETTAEIPY